ncbi:M28 family metallopeptidase [Haoranjiania flava]|uniref:M20/M25/M40 family metallo-hydrolase n=1 Tax=Haoranjiania flava TaxID=1856322 RepID=A0AAE3IN43_9BACT|nr:M20/M25/M40 family metallo-hydrolase [Haoranjiania flava]MCU7695043.1 M20/M25/M40 family metallo-hydrolase [Haoranjiania flava]
MHKNIFAILFFTFCILSVQAQTPVDKGLQQINKNNAEAVISFLASDELQGREAGTRNGSIAGMYLASCFKEIGLQPLNGAYLHPFAAWQPAGKARSGWESHPDSLPAIQSKGIYRSLPLRNVLGVIPGTRTDEFVVVGAHYDHLGIDELIKGDGIFNGADDNASGVSAVLQIAKAFKASGSKPLRTVIFALWDGEEKGLLGSKYFTATFPQIKNVKSYLNFDMIGRNNNEAKPQHVVFFYTAANKAFEQWLRADVAKYKLRLQPDYRAWDNPVGGSDNGSFAKAGIPILWYHTDGHPDYHQPTDEPSRLNWDKLVEITKAAYLNAWNMANVEQY